MRASSSQKRTLLAIIVSRLSILCVTTALSIERCRVHNGGYIALGHFRCPPPQTARFHPCFVENRSICRLLPEIPDCQLPKFRCSGDGRCILRSRYCNGIKDCNDGSDEWGCDTFSSDSTTTSTMRSEYVENTSPYIIKTTTMYGDKEEKSTSVILPEHEENTSSSSTTTGTILPEPEENTSSSSTATTSTILPEPEENTSSSSTTTTSTILPEPEENTSSSSTTTASTILPEPELNTFPSSSRTTRTMLPDSESNTTPPLTAKTILPTHRGDNTILSEFKVITSAPTINLTLPDSRTMRSCPDNYCMQNAECIVVQRQYRCKCPSSFSGELCEIQLGTEQGSHDYAVAIVTFMTLVILCLAVVSVCIYRHKRVSAWKSRDMTTRTFSQLTLTSNAVE